LNRVKYNYILFINAFIRNYRLEV
jgi:hypothetical protein